MEQGCHQTSRKRPTRHRGAVRGCGGQGVWLAVCVLPARASDGVQAGWPLGSLPYIQPHSLMLSHTGCGPVLRTQQMTPGGALGAMGFPGPEPKLTGLRTYEE